MPFASAALTLDVKMPVPITVACGLPPRLSTYRAAISPALRREPETIAAMVSSVCSLVLATTSGGMSRSSVLATYSQSAVVIGEIGASEAGSSASAAGLAAGELATWALDGLAAIAFDRMAAPLALISQR